MEVAVVIEGSALAVALQPWIYFQKQLGERGIHIHVFERERHDDAFHRAFDAMLLYG